MPVVEEKLRVLLTNFHRGNGGGSPGLRSEFPLSDDQMRAVAPHESLWQRHSCITTATVLQERCGEGFQPFIVCQTRVRQENRHR